MPKYWTTLGCSLLLLAPTATLGHGGRYRGPSDVIPPNLGGGGDTTPPGAPGPGGTPGPGAASPTNPGRPGVTGAGPVAPGPSTVGRAGRTGRYGKSKSSDGYERWEFWWEHNKESYLQLRDRLNQAHVLTGDAGFLTGRGQADARSATSRPSAATVKQQIVPLLRALLQSREADLADSACLALARVTPADNGAEVLPDLLEALTHSQKTVREAAALALGVLGNRQAVQPLRELLGDTEAGRRLMQRSEGVEPLVRAFAAASLGLLGDPAVVPDLRAVIMDQRSKTGRDVQAMAILALGQMPAEVHPSIIPFLLSVMDSRHLDRLIRAQVPIALGRMAGHSKAPAAVLSQLVQRFQSDKTDHDLARSLAIALGSIATMEDQAALDALRLSIERSKDPSVRHFAFMGLANIAARDEQREAHRDHHQAIGDLLLGELREPSRPGHSAFAALALAVASRDDDRQRRAAGYKILEAWDDTHNPSHLGAYAVSLGLLGHQPSREVLLEEYLNSRDSNLRGYLAMSLGLLGAKDQAPAFRALMLKKGVEPRLRLQLARSLGLLGDLQSVRDLVQFLASSDTAAESSSAAEALGLIGDHSATEPLLQIARQVTRPALARGFAAAALGMLAEKTRQPWNTAFAEGSNYRAKVDALAEILDLL